MLNSLSKASCLGVPTTYPQWTPASSTAVRIVGGSVQGYFEEIFDKSKRIWRFWFCCPWKSARGTVPCLAFCTWKKGYFPTVNTSSHPSQRLPRLVLLLMVAVANSCIFVVENPSHTLLWAHERFSYFCNWVVWVPRLPCNFWKYHEISILFP